MNIVKYLLVLGMAFLSLACPARSTYSLFTDKQVTPLPGIVGTWINHKGETYTFIPAADNGYIAVLGGREGETGQLEVRLGKLGNSWFLDSYPGYHIKDYHLLPVHCISKISIDGDSLRISSLEGDWLKHMIDTGQLKIDHIQDGGDIILTAPTEELQQLAVRFADNKNAFPEPSGLARMK